MLPPTTAQVVGTPPQGRRLLAGLRVHVYHAPADPRVAQMRHLGRRSVFMRRSMDCEDAFVPRDSAACSASRVDALLCTCAHARITRSACRTRRTLPYDALRRQARLEAKRLCSSCRDELVHPSLEEPYCVVAGKQAVLQAVLLAVLLA